MTASPILILHIAAGVSGILSGAAAMIFRKGSGPHKTAGKIFVISMLTMAAAASVLGYLRQEWYQVVSGISAMYVVTTAWITLRRKEGQTGRFEIVAFVTAMATAAGNGALGLAAANSDSGLIHGFPPGFYYFFAGLMAAFAAGDLRLILRGGIAGKQRMARHIWRACYAMFLATGSLFLGQMKVFPGSIRESNILFVPAFLPLVLMIYWLLRVGLTNRYRKAPAAPAMNSAAL
ncbi:MAG TPA: hypothetical protein VFX02_08875 [Gammaproteobacteria bacterium]|nr:hypothetical protein [Gammaproteobacteria bacterium]